MSTFDADDLPTKRWRANRLTGVLFTACALLGGVIYLELDGILFSSSATAEASPREIAVSVDTQPAPKLKFPQKSAFAVIVERPLFRPSRRPPAPVTAPMAAPQPQPETGGFRLRGVTIGGSREVALLEHIETGELHRIARTQVIDGWRVMSIEPLAVVLEQSGVWDVLKLER